MGAEGRFESLVGVTGKGERLGWLFSRSRFEINNGRGGESVGSIGLDDRELKSGTFVSPSCKSSGVSGSSCRSI